MKYIKKYSISHTLKLIVTLLLLLTYYKTFYFLV